MIQNNNSNNKIKENKYKILRMSLLLGNGDDKEETINNFEEAAREIDAMNDEVYLKDLEGKFYDTITLEEEEKKLSALVDYIGGRVDQRLSLLEDFSNVTGYELTNLPTIKYQERLEEYKNRLSYIKEYLDNTKNIDKLNSEIDNLNDELNNAYIKKAKNEETNKKSEEELLNKFNNIVKNVKEFKDINKENAEIKLTDIKLVVDDSKKSLDIFNKSFATLNAAGISGEEKSEYSSYVNSAKDAYYKNKEIEYLINLYIILNNKEFEFNKILQKRDSINEIIYDRTSLRKELNITTDDILEGMYITTERQYNDISGQRENIEKIEFLNNEIDKRKDLVESLEKDNQKTEILSLLKEFCLIDNYDDSEYAKNDDYNLEESELPFDDELQKEKEEDQEEDIDISEEDIITDNESEEDNNNNEIEFDTDNNDNNEIFNNEPEEESDNIEEDTIESTTQEEPELSNVQDNQIITVTDATNINIEEAIEKSNNVMKRVGEMLGVKVEPAKPIETPQEETPQEPSQESSQDKIKEETEEPIENNTIEEEKEEPEEVFENTEPEPEPNNDVAEEDNKEAEKEEEFDITKNIFMNDNFDADPETNGNQEPATQPSVAENPLFNSDFANKTIDDVMAENKANSEDIKGDFWFSQEETPMDLNSLPDIDNSNTNNNTFFENNDNIPNLDFPSLDVPNANNTETPNTSNKEDAE